ncbi:hypothetical protein GGR26_002132 [Lewinella marina]|uniref:Outer membrane protein beta-barrel domain-containing protein n=1 Tax=Neolewinella marina TaxID=438751 RepID=A0A2G0CGT2_9BACT|nr:hypothetical protein [Neolewinella marina]NJB86364.1 hypothetical protein [Neolewinella marina]PHK99168.1 hypothetical protein CGL56_06835 [Neolewinella marina]
MPQVHRYDHPYRFLALLLCLLPWLPGSGLKAQSPLDVGFHFSPQLRYVGSSAAGEVPTTGTYTRGKDGLSVGAGAGLYLEYEITPYWYLRGGVDFSYKRNYYATEKVVIEADTTLKGRNQVIFSSIEIPVAVVYRFDYLDNGDNFLVGVSTTLNRRLSNPRAWSTFGGNRGVKNKVDFAPRTVTVFAGYEREIFPYVLTSLEPYLTYAPTRFRLESTTESKVWLEAGLSVRVRLDN